MKKSILFSLMMALMMIGTYQVNAQVDRFIAQDLSKNHLEQILDKYGLDFVDSKKSNQKAFSVQVDSMISTVPNSDFEKAKEVKTYYNNGELHTHTFLYLTDNVWENSNRFVNSYNSNGDIVERLSENWAEGQWLSFSKITYTYYDFGNIHTRLSEIFENEIWVNSSLRTYGYDSDNYFVEYLSQNWEDNEWVNSIIMNTINNENGWWIIDLVKLWQDEEWVKMDSILYSYDDNGNNILTDSKYWVENEWVNGQFKLYNYDVEDRQTSISYLNWSGTDYMKFRRDSTMYDEFGLEDTKLTFFGNDSNEWEYGELSERVYDDTQNMVEETIQLWGNEQWNNGFFGDYSFEDGSITGVMYEWIDDNWDSCQQFRLLHFVVAGEQILRSYGENSIILYYSNVEVGIKEPSDITNQLEAYPNPTTGLYNIKTLNDNIKTIDVYQLNSQLVASYTPEGDQEFQLDLSDMPNGIYIIKVQSEKYITVLKTVKSN